MASTRAEERASKRYYDTHKSYRKKKIDAQIKKQKNNKSEYAKKQRKYYAENPEYREYKRDYAKKYRKKEPIKSKARKYRKVK